MRTSVGVISTLLTFWLCVVFAFLVIANVYGVCLFFLLFNSACVIFVGTRDSDPIPRTWQLLANGFDIRDLICLIPCNWVDDMHCILPRYMLILE